MVPKNPGQKVMDELKNLIKGRLALRTVFTRSANLLDGYLKQEDCDVLRAQEMLENLKARLERLAVEDEKIFEKMSASSEVTEEKTTEEAEAVFDYQDKYRRIEKAVNLLQKRKEPEILENQPKQSKNTATAKLPKLELSEFSGDVRKFYMFWNQFEEKINSNTDLSDSDKFGYLLHYVKGKPREMLDGMVGSANYADAVSLLKNTYGDKGIIETHLMSDLWALPAVTDVRQLQSQKDFVTKLEVTVRSLQGLGIRPSELGRVLKPVVFCKLPYAWKIEYERIRARQLKESSANLILDLENENQTDNSSERGRIEMATFDQFMEFLREELMIRIRAEQGSVSLGLERKSEKKEEKAYSTERAKEKPSGPKNPSLVFHAAVGNSSTDSNGQRSSGEIRNCIFCEDNHVPWRCDKTMTVADRKKKAAEKGACFVCLRLGHRAAFCRSGRFCSRCKKAHHEMFHDEKVKSTEETTACAYGSEKTLLMTAMATLSSGTNSRSVRVLVDACSTVSLITTAVSREIGCEFVRKKSMALRTVGGVVTEYDTNVVKAVLSGSTGKPVRVELTEIPELVGRFPDCDGDWLAEAEEMGLQLGDSFGLETNREVHVLLGGDVYKKVMRSKEPTIDLNSGPTLFPSMFGYLAHGPCEGKEDEDQEVVACAVEVEKPKNFDGEEENQPEPEVDFQKLWMADFDSFSLEVKLNAVDPVWEYFKENIKAGEVQPYCVPMPWKDPCPVLLDNRDAIEKRMARVESRLRRDGLWERYHESIKELELLGIVEKVFHTPKGTVNYLAHRPVYRENHSTMKTRPVFDASCKGLNGVSLNTCLEVGPNLLPDLAVLCTQFRCHKIAITADISKAYLMLEIDEKDRDCFRFLWNGDTYRFNRVCFGVNCGAFLLQATLLLHFEKENSRVASLIKSWFYMDDQIGGVQTIEEGKSVIVESKKILKKAGMNLCKFRSSSPVLNDFVKNEIGEPLGEDQKVLGLFWDNESDQMWVSNVSEPYSGVWNKRRILHVVAIPFDPLGMCSGVLLSGKLLLQKLWALKATWDEAIVDEEILLALRFLLHELEKLSEIKIPRHLASGSIIAIFCDSSTKGYATVAYLKSDVGTVDFIRAKSRVAPVKPTFTLPRLELQACVLGCQLAEILRKTFPDVKMMFFTDSNIALCWIKGDISKRKDIFVKNRVQKILSMSEKEDWSHVFGKENPSDLGTRPCKVKDLQSSLWLHGPDWLKADVSDWPLSKEIDVSSLDNQEFETVNAVMEETVPERLGLFEILDNSGSLDKVLRKTAWLMRFVNYLRDRKEGNPSVTGPLTAEELKLSEEKWVKWVQLEVFPKGVKEDRLRKLDPKLIDGLLYVGGRLGLAGYRMVLPADHRFTSLVIQKTHQRVGHFGVSFTLAQVREKYWVLQGRNSVKRALKKCVICNRFQSSNCREKAPSLPTDRSNFSGVFVSVGLDYFGPIELRNGNKCHVALFVCASVRAIHLEIVQDLSAESAIEAIYRFIARRGIPGLIRSDNATCFAAHKTQSVVAKLGIRWKFIPPQSPWCGGYYERLVKTVKYCMWKVVGKASLSCDQLANVLCSVEAIVNSRPLTYVASEDDVETLTPGHFLIGRAFLTPPLDDPSVELGAGTDLSKKWLRQQLVIRQFASRFQKEYVASLPRAIDVKGPLSRSVALGDVVVISEDGKKRLIWKLGVVVELHCGADGVARSVSLRTKDGIIKRAIQRLHLLGVNDENVVNGEKGPTNDSVMNDSVEVDEVECESENVERVTDIVQTRAGRKVKTRDILDL